VSFVQHGCTKHRRKATIISKKNKKTRKAKWEDRSEHLERGMFL
jgi:hypothetical protein